MITLTIPAFTVIVIVCFALAVSAGYFIVEGFKG